MNLIEIDQAWNQLVDSILRDWPELSADYLAKIAGDQGAFADYIAKTYDLTRNEAMK